MFPLSGYVDVNQTYQHDGVTLFNGMLAGKPQTILYFQPKNQAILAVFLEKLSAGQIVYRTLDECAILFDAGSADIFLVMQQAQQLYQKVQEDQKMMIAMAVHDARGLVDCARGRLFALQMRGGCELPVAQDCLAKASAVFQDVLLYGKLQAGEGGVNPTVCDLEQWVKELITVGFDTPPLPTYKITDQRTDTALAGFAKMDAHIMMRVVGNLLSNAKKFFKTFVCIEIVLTDENMMVTVINDAEKTIPAEQIPTLFNSYVQTAEGRAVQGSTGLGLAIVKLFVNDVLKGSPIEVTSDEKTKITTFQITVPCVTLEFEELAKFLRAREVAAAVAARGAAAAERESTPDLFARTLTPPRVLMVDDNNINRAIFSKILRKIGCQVEVASSGEEGLAKFKAAASSSATSYMAVFSDQEMPGMKGSTMVGEIVEYERAHEMSLVPKFMMTADADPALRPHEITALLKAKTVQFCFSKTAKLEELVSQLKAMGLNVALPLSVQPQLIGGGGSGAHSRRHSLAVAPCTMFPASADDGGGDIADDGVSTAVIMPAVLHS